MATNRVLALLVIVATVVFAVGVAIERSQESVDADSAEAAHVEVEASGEAGGSHSGEAAGSHSDEDLLGVDPESVGLVTLAVIASVALAAGVWFRPDLAWLLWLMAAAMLVFAALDVRELIHQLDESRGGLAGLVAVVTLLHGGAVLLAVRLLGQARPDPT